MYLQCTMCTLYINLINGNPFVVVSAFCAVLISYLLEWNLWAPAILIWRLICVINLISFVLPIPLSLQRPEKPFLQVIAGRCRCHSRTMHSLFGWFASIVFVGWNDDIPLSTASETRICFQSEQRNTNVMFMLDWMNVLFSILSMRWI